VTFPWGVWVDEVTDIRTPDDRPAVRITRVRPLPPLPLPPSPAPVAGVGRDGRYHPGRVVDPRVVTRAVELVEAATLRRWGARVVDVEGER